jgi:hypothetical protein
MTGRALLCEDLEPLVGGADRSAGARTRIQLSTDGDD